MAFPKSLCIFLVLLFLAVSYNAYACLVPPPQAQPMTHGSCQDTQDEPVRQFCDAFKTLSVQASAELHWAMDSHVFCSEDTASLALHLSVTSEGTRLCDHPADDPPQDLLLKNSVLRI